eukprot:CAMPEP_0115850970 /NCGR_PEP_ID=MMETSP0287-20121206/12238_1 /TAXON_ID=412157 /ORGANISM="Chrysochromulina rotalis, Strain UIO044" /LENGTH=208 /DNA_ID=CAMNT_0003304983 /DNA_START=3 /DNA_END=629 /DNA_ORIENTATION=+
MADNAPSKAFVIGSIAHWLGKKAEESRSHEWTIYLRAANPEEDLSVYIKKVVFILHPTLQPPTRTLETGPFEVTDQGWGEFEVTLQVFFHDSREKPVELQHMLKLYPEGDSQQLVAKPVVAERYDEFVFNSPSEGLRQRLTADVSSSSKGWRQSANGKWFTDHDAEAPVEAQALQQAYQVITSELQVASKRRRTLEDELKQLQEQSGA